MKNQFIGMLALCWKPGQCTPIHDHNGSHGAVFVHEGILWETMFDYDTETGLNYRSHRELRTGGPTGSEVPDIHQLGNPDVSGRDLVTISHPGQRPTHPDARATVRICLAAAASEIALSEYSKVPQSFSS